jgi:hypothetical protein
LGKGDIGTTDLTINKKMQGSDLFGGRVMTHEWREAAGANVSFKKVATS